MMNKLTIVIPVLNQENNIRKCIKSIRGFDKEGIEVEVIVIDNGSTDNTVSIAKSYADVVISKPDFKIGEMRNFGVSISSGEYIGFIDSDCAPSAKWAKTALDILKNNNKIGMVGCFYSAPHDAGWIEKYWTNIRPKKKHFVKFLPAGNCATRKSHFIELGGFSTSLKTGEDYDLCQRYKRNSFLILNDPNMETIHYGNAKNFMEIFRRELWYGSNYFDLIKKGEISNVVIGTTISFFGWIFCLLSPLLLLVNGSFPINFFLFGLLLMLFYPSTFSFYLFLRDRRMISFFAYLSLFFVYFGGRVMSLSFLLIGFERYCKK